MVGIDPEKLIKAMKMRPVLYNRNDKLYHSLRTHKDKLWREISEEVHGNWSQLSELHKFEYVREIQKRWKSLKTCFSRELALQKQENIKWESDQHVKRRKRYEYFDNLQFLLDGKYGGDETRVSDDSVDLVKSSHQLEETYDHSEPSSNIKNVHTVKAEPGTEQNYPLPQAIYRRNSTLEEKIIDMLRDGKKDEIDENRQFMLSLVPTFSKLNTKQKLAARIEILKVLQTFSFDKD